MAKIKVACFFLGYGVHLPASLYLDSICFLDHRLSFRLTFLTNLHRLIKQ